MDRQNGGGGGGGEEKKHSDSKIYELITDILVDETQLEIFLIYGITTFSNTINTLTFRLYKYVRRRGSLSFC